MTTAVAAIRATDPRQLAAVLAEHDLPGRRSMTAITKLRRQRAANRVVPDYRSPQQRLRDKLHATLRLRYRAEITRRGGETTIVDQYGGIVTVDIADRASLRDVNGATCHLTLMRAEGWRSYGRAGNRYVHLAYLCGTDDAGPWAVRVPGTTANCRAALDWLTPAAVRAALRDGRRVRRQGDVYLVETTARRDGHGLANLPEGHQWNPDTRWLTHRPADGRRHSPVQFARPVEFVGQRAYEMGRSGARVAGD